MKQLKKKSRYEETDIKFDILGQPKRSSNPNYIPMWVSEREPAEQLRGLFKMNVMKKTAHPALTGTGNK